MKPKRRSRGERWPGFIEGCTRDPQLVRADWTPLQDLIEGVRVHEVRSVMRAGKVLTEVYRQDWGLDAAPVGQVFQVRLAPGGVSAWHAHRNTVDRLFVNDGMMRVVLYDARPDSSTTGWLNEFAFGLERPALVVVPPGVWHGLQNLSHQVSSVLNLVDHAYAYEDPDHWRLPEDTRQIPYRFDR
jgi:dTDP-4-dehydrorhamnose 3,5-epimerase